MASVLAISDFIFNNLLTDLNLNPVWEKWRGYFFAGSIVCSLFPFYMTLAGLSLQCVPGGSIGRNGSEPQIQLTTSQTAYINSYCAADPRLLMVRYSGVVMLGQAILILLESSIWLHVKSVKQSFRTFSEACVKLHEKVLPVDYIKQLRTKPLKNDDSSSHKTVREVCMLLTLQGSQPSVFFCYVVRSALLFVILCCGIGISFFWFSYNINSNCGPSSSKHCSNVGATHHELLCQLDGSAATNGLMDLMNVTCTVNVVHTITSFVVAFDVTLLLQIITLLYIPIHIAVTKRKLPTYSNHSVNLMMEFWDSASSTRSGVLKTLIYHLFSQQFEEECKFNLKNRPELPDTQLIELRTRIFPRETPDVIQNLTTEFIKTIEHRTAQYASCDEFSPFLKAARYSVEDESTKIFAKKLQEKKHWELLVYLLEHSNLKVEIDVRDALSLNDDELNEENPGRPDFHSILYYAFLPEHDFGPVRFAAARHLCKNKTLDTLSVTEVVETEERSTPLERFLLNRYGEQRASEILKQVGLIFIERDQNSCLQRLQSYGSRLANYDGSIFSSLRKCCCSCNRLGRGDRQGSNEENESLQRPLSAETNVGDTPV